MQNGEFLTAADLHLAETEKHKKTSSRKSRWKWRLAFYVVLFLVGMFVGMITAQKPTAQVEELQEQVAVLEDLKEEWRIFYEDCRKNLVAFQEQRSTPTGEASNPTSETEGVQSQRTATVEAQAVPYEIVEEEDISHKAMGNKKLSDFTLQELTSLPLDKRFSYRVVVGTSITLGQVRPTVEAIIAGLTQHDPDIDEIHLLLYSTKDRVHDMYDIAMATWSTDGRMGGITPEIARSNNRSGYEISLTVKENFEECLAQISKTEVQFGLSEQTRREFHAALVRCQDQALLEADKHYTVACSNCPEYIENNVMKLSQMYNDLLENCAPRLREEYGITEEVQKEILWESYEENWPLPALPPEPGCCDY